MKYDICCQLSLIPSDRASITSSNQCSEFMLTRCGENSFYKGYRLDSIEIMTVYHSFFLDASSVTPASSHIYLKSYYLLIVYYCINIIKEISGETLYFCSGKLSNIARFKLIPQQQCLRPHSGDPHRFAVQLEQILR